jgi:hypothetical protein
VGLFLGGWVHLLAYLIGSGGQRRLSGLDSCFCLGWDNADLGRSGLLQRGGGSFDGGGSPECGDVGNDQASHVFLRQWCSVGLGLSWRTAYRKKLGAILK